MRMTRRILSLLLSLLLSLALFGCDGFKLPFSEGAQSGGTQSGEEGNVEFSPTVYTFVTKDTFEKSYSDQLSPNERAVYDAVLAATPGATTVDVTLPELPKLCRGRAPSDEEMSKLSDDIGSFAANALYAAWLDSPTLFWLDHSKYSYDIAVESDDDGVVYLKSLKLHLTTTASADVIHEQLAALIDAVKDFTPTGATVPEKIAYINTYLTSHIEYDLDAPNRGTIIGALVDGRCVCEGYARAFDYLCEKAEIDTVCIPGYAYTDEHPEGEGHMWNAVRIDGAFYAIDTTWNDTTETAAYLLVGSETVCNDETFGKSHKPNMLINDGPHKAFALPSISKMAYSTNP